MHAIIVCVEPLYKPIVSVHHQVWAQFCGKHHTHILHVCMHICMYVMCTHPRPQLGKHCQELLMAVATNCSTHQSEDLKVIESLLAIRLKTKLFSNQFVGCIR